MDPHALPRRPRAVRLQPTALRQWRWLLLLAGLPATLLLHISSVSAAGAAAGGGSTTPTLGQAIHPSSPEQLSLSDFLRQRGALFYGAWWCPACFRQKNLFGQEAGDRLPYVECDKSEVGRERCAAEGIKAYPTWALGKERLEGVQSLDELKRWSGYPGNPSAPRSKEPSGVPTVPAANGKAPVGGP